MSPDAATFLCQIVERSECFDEGRRDAREERGAAGQGEFDLASPDRAWRARSVPSLSEGLFEFSVRVLMCANPAIILAEEPDSQALASSDDRRFIDEVHSVGGSRGLHVCSALRALCLRANRIRGNGEFGRGVRVGRSSSALRLFRSLPAAAWGDGQSGFVVLLAQTLLRRLGVRLTN